MKIFHRILASLPLASFRVGNVFTGYTSIDGVTWT
jgi:hypothetical protein